MTTDAEPLAPTDWSGYMPLGREPYRRPMRRMNIAYIFLIFFGFIGVHRFYAGSVGLGIAYIFTFGFFGVGVFIDIFLLGELVEKENRRRGYVTQVLITTPITGGTI